MFEKLFKKEKKSQALSVSARGNLKAGTASAKITSTGPWRYLSGLPQFIIASKAAGISGDTVIYSLTTDPYEQIVDGDYSVVYCLQSDMTKTGILIIHVDLLDAFEFTIHMNNAGTWYLPCSQDLTFGGGIEGLQIPYSWRINWGDGSVEDKSGLSNDNGSSYIVHTYNAAGDYRIKIKPIGVQSTVYGWLEAFGFGENAVGCNTQANRNNIISIDTPLMLGAKYGRLWDGNPYHVSICFCYSTFAQCQNLKSIPANFIPPITQVNRGSSYMGGFALNGTFRSCTSLKTVGDNFLPASLSNSVIGAGFASQLFSYCTNLESSVNTILGNFTISSTAFVLDDFQSLSQSFFNCAKLTGDFAALVLVNQYTPTSDISTFYNCTGVANYATLNANWK